MPRGSHFTTCWECGKGFVCGDCIHALCSVCRGKENILSKMGWKEAVGFLASRWSLPGSDTQTSLRLTEAYDQLRQQYPVLPATPDIAEAYRLRLPEVTKGEGSA
jgi:hypothetical protein